MPATVTTFVPISITLTKVWPTVSTTGLPLPSKKRVGAVKDSQGAAKWEDVERAMDFWAVRLRAFLDEVHSQASGR